MSNDMTDRPRVSVILPTYNAAATASRAIASIQRQTGCDWELIVIDDGSADDTARQTAEIARSDSRIRLLQRRHVGLVAALNAGLETARGAYIARMDADDESLPGRLARQSEFLDRNHDIGMVGCLVEFGGDRAISAGYALHVDWINSLQSPDAIALNRFIESPFAHPSVMFRRELIERFGGYRSGAFPEDYELWLRWSEGGVRMSKVPEVLLRWNDPPTRLSRNDARYAPDAFFRIKAEWLAKEMMRRCAEKHRPVWVWGAGRPTRKRASHLIVHGVRIAGYIDVDVKKTGRSVGALPVVAPVDMPGPNDAFVLGYVSSRGARELIRDALGRRGYVEGTDFLMCA